MGHARTPTWRSRWCGPGGFSDMHNKPTMKSTRQPPLRRGWTFQCRCDQAVVFDANSGQLCSRWIRRDCDASTFGRPRTSLSASLQGPTRQVIEDVGGVDEVEGRSGAPTESRCIDGRPSHVHDPIADVRNWAYSPNGTSLSGAAKTSNNRKGKYMRGPSRSRLCAFT